VHQMEASLCHSVLRGLPGVSSVQARGGAWEQGDPQRRAQAPAALRPQACRVLAPYRTCLRASPLAPSARRMTPVFDSPNRRSGPTTWKPESHSPPTHRARQHCATAHCLRVGVSTRCTLPSSWKLPPRTRVLWGAFGGLVGHNLVAQPWARCASPIPGSPRVDHLAGGARAGRPSARPGGRGAARGTVPTSRTCAVPPS
jgi:hypothetical protein